MIENERDVSRYLGVGRCVVTSLVLAGLSGCSGSAPSKPTDATAGTGGSDTAGAGPQAGTTGNGDGAAGDPGDGAAGTMGTDKQVAPMNLGFIAGPVTDDQAIVTVPASHAGFPIPTGWGRNSGASTGGGASIFFDTEGNLFLVSYDGTLYKYSPSLEPLWHVGLPSAPGLDIAPNTMISAADGGIYFGGRTAVYPGPKQAISVGKLNSDGTLDWLKTWDTAIDPGSYRTDTNVNMTAATADGALIAAGSFAGLAPDNPATVAKGPWIARYEADGTRTFLKQYPCDNGACSDQGLGDKLIIDASGNIDMVLERTILKVDAQGTMIASIPLRQDNTHTFDSYLDLDTAPDKNGFYSWTNFLDANFMTTNHLSHGSLGLAKYDVDGTLLWYRYAELPRTAVADAAPNKTWTGVIPGDDITYIPTRVLVAKDAIYLSGIYQNSYASGQTTFPIYVGRYDLNGNREWFQELTVEGVSAADLGSMGDAPDLSIMGIALDPAANPVVFVTVSHLEGNLTVPGSGYLFKLSAADGSVM